MKHILIILALFISSCKKDEVSALRTSPSNCSVDFNLVKDIQWHPLNPVFANLKFETGGIYYENNSNDGNWTLTNGCDSIHITRPSNNFYYRVNSVTADTLRLYNSTFGEVIFYN